MVVPILLPIVLGVAGWFTGEWAGAVVGFVVGELINVAVIGGAIAWARRFGPLLDHEEAWELAPRPPGYRRLCDWVYERTLPKQDDPGSWPKVGD